MWRIDEPEVNCGFIVLTPSWSEFNAVHGNVCSQNITDALKIILIFFVLLYY